MLGSIEGNLDWVRGVDVTAQPFTRSRFFFAEEFNLRLMVSFFFGYTFRHKLCLSKGDS